MPRRRRYDELTACANTLAGLCVAENIAHLEINIGDSAVSFRRFDVPMLREDESLRIVNGKAERV